MKLKMTYATRDDLPKGMEELYTEQSDGTFKFDGVEGLKTEDDTAKLKKSLDDERKAHKETKTKLQSFGDLNADEVRQKLDGWDELEARANANGKGGIAQEDVDKIVEGRVKRALGPVERERDQLRQQVTTLTAENGQLSGTIKTGKVEGAVRKVATELKVIGPAMDDVMMRATSIFEIDEHGDILTKEGISGVTPGIAPDVWLKDMQEKAPHWWATSVGGGALGGSNSFKGQPNPFSAEHWNLTKQGEIYQQDKVKADQMAKVAGTTVGGPMPQPRK